MTKGWEVNARHFVHYGKKLIETLALCRCRAIENRLKVKVSWRGEVKDVKSRECDLLCLCSEAKQLGSDCTSVGMNFYT